MKQSPIGRITLVSPRKLHYRYKRMTSEDNLFHVMISVLRKQGLLCFQFINRVIKNV